MQLSEKYKILRTLGGQNTRKFGHVFLVQEKQTLELFVMKHASFQGLDSHLCQRIRNEHRFTFQHDGFPVVHESIINEEESYLILKFKEGQTLDNYWKTIRKGDKIRKLKELLCTLAPIFEHLRHNNLVHCDIKPSNILVSESDHGMHVDLLDFGLTLNTNEDLHDRQILFPLGYAAPELVLNQLNCIDHTSDLFALGIVIWRLFAGKLPLTHPNPSIFTNLQITHPIPEHAEIPKELFRILSKMCFKHQFSTSPNRIPYEEVQQYLLAAKDQRYRTLPEVLNDLNELNERTNWFNKVLFGNRGRN
jgi:serine/threonine protein kinase